MARRRRRDKIEDDDEVAEKESSRDKYREDEAERKIKRSRRKRRESYDRRQDLAMFTVLIIIIAGIILGYFYYINYMPEDDDDIDDFNTYTPPINPDDHNNGGDNGGGSNGATTIYDIPSGITASDAGNTLAVIEIQDYGAMVIELYDSKMPITVANFVEYLNVHFYDGLLIHRISQNPDIIQGGGMEQDGTYKNTNQPIQLETAPDLNNEEGTIAMARTTDPDSATSQWYINCAYNDYLDGQYAVFGRVIYGDSVYQAVNNVPVNGEEPVNPVIIKSAYVYTPTL